MKGVPTLCQVVLDTTDARGLAEFYRELLELRYRPGDEPPAPGDADSQAAEWLVLRHPDGHNVLAFQPVQSLPRPTWPGAGQPQQLHLDLMVSSAEELSASHERAIALGARLLLDRFDDPEEPLRVYADPSGHPFCVFVA